MTSRDLLLARRAKAAGARPSLRIIMEARRAGLPSLALAFAVIEQESGFRNIFGHDSGADRSLYGKPVTKERVQQLLRGVSDHTFASNGIGLSQLTWLGYIRQAEALGGAHLERNQLRVGFQALAGMVHAYGEERGLAAYNSGTPDSSKGRRYAREVLEKKAKWHKILSPR